MDTPFVQLVRELVRLNRQAEEDQYLDTGEVIELADRAEQLLQQREGEGQPGTGMDAFALDTATLPWEAIGPSEDPETYLLATVMIDGVFHHLEARQVQDDEEGTQQVGCDKLAEAFDQLKEAFGADGPFWTVEIKERQYALFMSPYCR